jgi:hypothetical protein
VPDLRHSESIIVARRGIPLTLAAIKRAAEAR